MNTTLILGIAAITLAIILMIFNRINNPYRMKRKDLLLVNAVIKNNSQELEKFLKKGGSPDAVDKKGMPVLVIAAQRGREELVKLLLRYGANPNRSIPQKRKEISGGTALIAAAGNGSTSIVKRLLSHEADVNQADHQGFTPLMSASYKGNEVVVKKLLEKGAATDDSDHEGFTALMYAANAGKAGVVNILLQHGANPESKDRYSKTAHDYANERKHAQTLKILKKAMIQNMRKTNSNATYRPQKKGL